MTNDFKIFMWDLIIRPFRDFFRSAKHLANFFLWLCLITFTFALLEKFNVAKFIFLSDIRITFTFLVAYIILTLIKKWESGEWKYHYKQEKGIITKGEIKRLKEEEQKKEKELVVPKPNEVLS